ncbi:hypothetical protein KFL_000220020 [Klebsormidium nitens]|uniref:F-box domain-containing protein n=1 Tax=Klebsormidium nitens TaxID=105231 RepID=A0A1Y1HK77_KLENI|nr:hypothetical protein KFL_000220020 [Klebsormidium nitens]|eukprot:GAQ78970.1 hypothetical protein KFL_000220020 [Klebsormidium nitens]
MASGPARKRPRRRLGHTLQKPSKTTPGLDSECQWEKLPDDVITRILSLASLKKEKPSESKDACLEKGDWPGGTLPLSAASLCKLGAVCSMFRRLVPQVESVAWEFEYSFSGPNVLALVQFAKRAQMLRGLRIYREYDLGPILAEDLTAILRASPQLTTLELHESVVDDSYESDEEFDGDGEQTGVPFTAQQLFDALANCPQLVAVSLWLEHLDLVKPFKVSHSFCNLRQLSLNTRGTIVSDGLVSGAAVAYLVRLCPNLQSLSLRAEPDGTGKLFLVSGSLEVVDLVGFAVLKLRLETPSLVTLRLGWCPERVVLQAPQLATFQCTNAVFNLSEFKLAVPWQLTELILSEEIEQEELLAGLVLCPGLKRLDLSGLTFTYGHFDLRTMRALAGLKHLEELLIDSEVAMEEQNEGSDEGDFDLTPENIMEVVLPSLRSLRVNLATAECLSFAGLFVMRAPKLRELVLGVGDLNRGGCNCFGADGLCLGVKGEIIGFQMDVAMLNPEVRVRLDTTPSKPAEDSCESDEDPDDSEDDLDLSDVQGYFGGDSESDGSGGGRSESEEMGERFEVGDSEGEVSEEEGFAGEASSDESGSEEDVAVVNREDFDFHDPEQDDASDWEEGREAWGAGLSSQVEGGKVQT